MQPRWVALLKVVLHIVQIVSLAMLAMTALGLPFDGAPDGITFWVLILSMAFFVVSIVCSYAAQVAWQYRVVLLISTISGILTFVMHFIGAILLTIVLADCANDVQCSSGVVCLGEACSGARITPDSAPTARFVAVYVQYLVVAALIGVGLIANLIEMCCSSLYQKTTTTAGNDDEDGVSFDQ